MTAYVQRASDSADKLYYAETLGAVGLLHKASGVRVYRISDSGVT